jgi:cytoskeletal protein RodZ
MPVRTCRGATMSLAAFLLASSACAQEGARDKSTNQATASTSSPTQPADQAAATMPSASPAQAPAQAPTAAAGTPATAAAKAGEIQGRVELVDRADNLVIAGSESAGLAFDQFKVDKSTDVTIDGAKASINEVNPGDEVRVSFSGSGNDLRVNRIDVLPSAGAGPSAEGTGSGHDEK